ncbi:MAG: hypothetical protein K9J12_02905 [Melioribacteraceae bacterium]|nr:hypothetical protein [Melioribacteraceae bacterium]MCF8263328.1 hypothetical protein [Melioribacteraceae bacterium]MCF8414317.1 hypothetical protein [Melioribacteraceae bacterium]MCF8431976.1 hypothetical protein [Melioribacteraceae bacterium]
MKKLLFIMILLIGVIPLYSQDAVPSAESGDEVIKSYNGVVETDYFKTKFPSKFIKKTVESESSDKFSINAQHYFVKDENNPELQNGVKLYTISAKDENTKITDLEQNIIDEYCQYTERNLINAALFISGLADVLMDESVFLGEEVYNENTLNMRYTKKVGEVTFKTKVFGYVKQKGKDIIYFIVYSTNLNETPESTANSFINAFQVKI